MEKNEEQSPDFEKFISGYKPKTIFWKSWKGFSAIMVGGASVLGILYLLLKPSSSESVIHPFINPPLKGVDVEYSQYKLRPGFDTILKYEKGSNISVPANSFVDVNGKIIQESVEIKYREFHDAADFFVSGIPMSYDSAGIEYHFESAGMLEILCFSNGKQVYPNPLVQIKVNMLSDNPGDRFLNYYLDTAKKSWTYISSGKASKSVDKHKISSEIKVQPKVEEAPLPPCKIDSGLYSFDIAYDKKEFPELASYENVRFEVSADDKNFDPEYASKTWDAVNIEKSRDKKNYKVTFTSGQESHVFIVNPVFEGAAYTKAKELFELRLLTYKGALNTRNKEEQKQKQKEDSLYKVQYFKVTNANNRYDMKTANENARGIMETQLFRIFTISRFGVWNSDYAKNVPQGLVAKAKFMDQDLKKIELGRVYHLEKGVKRIITYSFSQYMHFSYNPSEKNLVMGVTWDNKLAIFNTDDFAKLKLRGDTASFAMKVFTHPIKNVNEVRALLKL
jgi:hypothetical protein